MKGSYVVTKVGSEKKVSFDNGLNGSIAEDAYFAIKAMDMGFTFNFIEGEMREKSPFSFSDFIKQRKRWMQGIYLVAFDFEMKGKDISNMYVYKTCANFRKGLKVFSIQAKYYCLEIAHKYK